MHLSRIIAVVSVAFVLSTELFAFPAPVKHSLEQQEEQRLSQSTNGITKHSRSVQGFFEPNFERDVDKSLEKEHVNFDRSYDDNDQHVRGFLQPNIERDDDGLREHSTIERDLFESSRDDHIVSVPRSDDDAAFRKIFLTDAEKGKGKGIFQKAGKALSKVAKALKPGRKQKALHRQAVDNWMANNVGWSADPPWQGAKRSVDVSALTPRGDSDDEDDDDDDSSSRKSSMGLLQTLNKVKAGFRDKKRGKKHGSDSSSSSKGIGSSSKPQPSRSSSKSSSSAKSTPAASPTASPEKSPPRPDDETIKKVDEWKAGASKGLLPWTPRPWRHGKRALSSFSLSARDDDDDSSDSGSALRKLFGSPDGSKKGLLRSISGKAVKPILSHSDTYSPGGTPTDSSSHSSHSKKTKEKAVSPKKALQAVAAGPSFRHASYKRPSSVGNPSTSLMRPPQPVRLQSSSSFRLPRPNPILDPHAHNVAKIERWKAQALREGAEKPEPWQGAGQRDLPDEHLFKRFLNKMKKVVKGAKNVVKAAKSDSDSSKSGTPPARSAEVSPQSSPKKESQGTSQKAGTSSSTFQLRPGSPNTLRKVKTKVDNWRAGHGDTRHKPEDHWSPPPGYKTEHKDLYAPGSPDHGTAEDLYPHSDSQKRSNKVQFFVNEAGDSLPEHSKRDLNDAEHPAEEDLEARLVDRFKKVVKGKAKKAAKNAKSPSGSDDEGSHEPLVKPKEGSTATPSWQKQASSKGSEHRSRHGSGSSSPVSGERAGPSFQPPPHKSPETKWERQKQLEHTVDRWKLFSLGDPPSDHEDEDDRRDLDDNLSEEQYLEERLVSNDGKALKSVVKGKSKSDDHPPADSDKKSEHSDKSEAGQSPGGVSPFWELEGKGKVGSSSKPSRNWKEPRTWGKGNKKGKQNAEAAMKSHDSPHASPTKWFAGSGHQSPSYDHGDSERRDWNDEHLEEELEARLLGKMKDKIKGKGKKKKASKSQSSSSKSSKPPPKHAYDEAGGGSSTTTPEWLDQGTAQRGGYSSSSSSSAGSGAGPSSPPAWKPTSPSSKKKHWWQSSKKLKAKELAKKIEEWQGVHSDDEKEDDRRDLTGEEEKDIKDKLQRIDWD